MKIIWGIRPNTFKIKLLSGKELTFKGDVEIDSRVIHFLSEEKELIVPINNLDYFEEKIVE